MQQRWAHLGAVIPGLAVGTVYKYEVRSPRGTAYRKADPYGFQHEIAAPDGARLAVPAGNFPLERISLGLKQRDSRDHRSTDQRL